MPAFIDTGLNLVDVRDTAAGHLLACERGRPGERYILGCENLTLAQILREAGARSPAGRRRACGFRTRVAYAAGVVSTGWARLTGRAAARAAGRGADGAQEDVGDAREGRAASWASTPARPKRRCDARWSGFAANGYC